MTEYVTSALFVHTEDATHLIEPLQNNSAGARITPVAFDAFMQSPQAQLAGVDHVVVAGPLDVIKGILSLATDYHFSIGILPTEKQKDLIKFYDLPKNSADAVDLALLQDGRVMDLVLCNGKIMMFKATVGQIPLLDTPAKASWIRVLAEAMKNLVHLSILIFFVFWLNGCEPKPASEPSGKTIKIGLIAPLSGPEDIKGKEGLRGIQFAMRMQPYLQNGDRIEVVTEDDKNNPALAAQSLRNLVQKNKISAIITFSTSDPVLAMAKVADNYKTPILAAIATHPDITAHSGFISQLCFDDQFQGTTAALFVRDELLIDTVAVFSNPRNAYSRYLAARFESKFKSIGGEITDWIRLTEEPADLPKKIKRVHEHKPELIYLPIGANDVLHIIRELRNLRWKPQMMGSDGLISTMLAQHKQELHLLDGMLAIDFFAHVMPLTAFGEEVKEAYEDMYRGKFRGASTAYSLLGVEGYALLLDAMNRCNDPADRECLNNQIRSTDNFTGFIGNITIGSDGKAQRPLCINSIRNGLSKFIVKVY